jgi:hypothetical protein
VKRLFFFKFLSQFSFGFFQSDFNCTSSLQSDVESRERCYRPIPVATREFIGVSKGKRLGIPYDLSAGLTSARIEETLSNFEARPKTMTIVSRGLSPMLILRTQWLLISSRKFRDENLICHPFALASKISSPFREDLPELPGRMSCRARSFGHLPVK